MFQYKGTEYPEDRGDQSEQRGSAEHDKRYEWYSIQYEYRYMPVAEEIGIWYSTHVHVVVRLSDSGYRCRVGLSQYEYTTACDMETD